MRATKQTGQFPMGSFEVILLETEKIGPKSDGCIACEQQAKLSISISKPPSSYTCVSVLHSPYMHHHPRCSPSTCSQDTPSFFACPSRPLDLDPAPTAPSHYLYLVQGDS
jgi:hypothetical protein